MSVTASSFYLVLSEVYRLTLKGRGYNYSGVLKRLYPLEPTILKGLQSRTLFVYFRNCSSIYTFPYHQNFMPN